MLFKRSKLLNKGGFSVFWNDLYCNFLFTSKDLNSIDMAVLGIFKAGELISEKRNWLGKYYIMVKWNDLPWRFVFKSNSSNVIELW